MENIWSVFCSKAIVDERSKLVTLIEALDALSIPEKDLPTVDPKNPVNVGPISLQIVSFWYRSDFKKPETSKVRIIFVTPDGQEIKQTEIEVDLQNTVSRHLIVVIPALTYVGLGMYHFVMEKMDEGKNEWVRTARLPLLLMSEPKKS